MSQIVSERGSSGRVNVHGRVRLSQYVSVIITHHDSQMYTPSGTLVAVCNQEGVSRVDLNELKASSKL